MPSAVTCGRKSRREPRFPKTPVHYRACDLFKAPENWTRYFDFVLESYTLQVLPWGLRQKAIKSIASFVKSAGTLLVIRRGRQPIDPEGKMPWPLTIEELDGIKSNGLKEIIFEDFMDDEEPPVRRFRVTYQKLPNEKMLSTPEIDHIFLS